MLLVASVGSSGFLLPGLFVFLSSWTDERGLIASALVFVFHLLPAPGASGPPHRLALRKASYSVLAAWFLYFGGRWYLTSRYGLRTTAGDINVKTFVDNCNILAIGLWTALEGGWFLVLVALFDLLKRKSWLLLCLFSGGLGLVSVVGIPVFDVTRSLSYLLPALFLGLAIVARENTKCDVRIYCAIACLTSIVFPNYYVSMVRYINWFYPLPFQFLRGLVGNGTS